MADNALPSTDPNVATDDVAGVHFQRMKLVDGTLDGTEAIPGSAARGLTVDPRLKVARLAQTPAISNGVAYAAKDAIGGLLTFANAARAAGGSCRIDSVQIEDKGQQLAALDVVFFDRSITAPTNNAVFAPTDAEVANVVGFVSVAAGDYADFSTNAVADVPFGREVVLNGADLYAVLVARGTPTYTSVADLVVTVTVTQD